MRHSLTIAASLLALTVANTGALAQSEAQRQSGQLGPASGNTGGASNGVGTSGSLDRNAGSASSTVAGQQSGGAPLNTQGSNRGAGGTVESDPSLGGDKKPQ